MHMLQSQRRATSATKRVRARGPAEGRTPARKRAGSRETWITDPNALLTALAKAESAARAEEELACRVVAAVAELPVCLQPTSEPSTPQPLPTLHEDERIGHASQAGVIVIIRRRRAA
jgi:hypothetical protein